MRIELVKRDEELKGVREQIVQKSFQVRLMEDTLNESNALQEKNGKLIEEVEQLRNTVVALQ